MDLTRIGTEIGVLSLAPIVLMYVISAMALPLGALSLPCMTMLTSFVYFYLMPVVALASGDNGYFGMFMSDMGWTHLAVLVYALGASLAFLANWKTLRIDPVISYPSDRKFNVTIYRGLWGLALLGAAAQVALGKLNIFGLQNYVFAFDEVAKLGFLTEAFNLMVPLTLILLIREKFNLRSLVILAIVLWAFLQTGFRFRIIILLAAAVGSYASLHGMKIRMIKGVLSCIAGLLLVNVMGTIRRYGEGIDLSRLSWENFDAMTNSFGGEFGIVYVLDFMATNPLPPPAPLDPWVVAMARLVPSFIWPDKPVAVYLTHMFDGATVGAEKSGVAASQHAEMLLQVGWWGLLPLAFLYYWLACRLLRFAARASFEVRLAGYTLIPAFFGFYMQTRGYFFQVFVDFLFTLAPLLILSGRRRRVAAGGQYAVRGGMAPQGGLRLQPERGGLRRPNNALAGIPKSNGVYEV